MVTRADTLTETSKKKEYYSDFLNSFFPLPNGGDIAKTINENAVKQSVKNLVLTNVGDRFFQPDIGTNVNRSLFEFNDLITSLELTNYIQNTIKYHEPRAIDVSVTVLPVESKQYLQINIIFYVINNPNPIDLTLNLKRVR